MLKALLIAVLCLVAGHGAAQNATCQSGFAWSFNSLNQSPCDIAAFLASVCINQPFILQPLQPGFEYFGPPAGLGNPCRCSTVYYSLLSACSVCQLASFIRWTDYETNCSTVFSQVFNPSIPPYTKVPHYAYLDVTAGDTFNVTLAQAAGGTESTSLPSPTSPTSPTSATSSGKKSNSGAIAGGVVGGILGLLVIAGSIYWILRRKKQAAASRADIDPVVFTSQNQLNVPPTPPSFPSTSPPMRLYDPNDPSTYPISNSNSHMSYNPYIVNHSQPGHQMPPSGNFHPGVPEV
ncbi:hypothetical protein GALMADRAFT_229495 [Galerina marginata CBS 339.88]|uniref:Mid2 domain-containing protein n=1 Tax=Galerina marginata (strain CBS 339.88) TaxID=685588 RepID=A0A067SV21_GALM3|nr:hypothetical protein GALMADRAFT_229495 [Galerina marginata CBS 339.88]